MATILVILFFIALLGYIGFMVQPHEAEKAFGKPLTRKQLTMYFVPFILILLIGIGIVGANVEQSKDSNTTSNSSQEQSTATEPVNSSNEQEESVEYKLALLHEGTVPKEVTVNRFHFLLESLEKGCKAENQERIADYITVTKKNLFERGIDDSYLEIAEALNDSIPSEAEQLLECSELAAAFVTIRIQQ